MLDLDSISLLSQLENLPFLSYFRPFNALIIASFSNAFLTLITASYLDWSWIFYLWRFCHCSDQFCYSRQGKEVAQAISVIFFNVLAAHLSNSRFLGSIFQRRFCLFAGYCGQRYFSVTATAMLGIVFNTTLLELHYCQTDTHPGYYPYHSSYWRRQQGQQPWGA